MSWAVVTGASAGIGEELSLQLARRGYNVALLARREDRLHALAKRITEETDVDTTVIAADLGTAKGMTIARKGLQKLDIEVLCNNAGYGDSGAFAESDLNRTLGMIDLNVRALTEFTHMLLPRMKERGKGYVLQVASTAGFVPGPGMAVYFATKAYVVSLNRALRVELKGSGVSMTSLNPPGVHTEFTSVAGMGEDRFAKGMTPDVVAERALKGLFAGKQDVFPNLYSKTVGHFANRVIPSGVLARAVDRFF